MTKYQTAMITGGSSGIGWAIAKRLVEDGIRRIVVVGSNTERLDRTKQELAKLGADAYSHRVDLSEPGAGERVYQLCRAENHNIDLLINSAGFAMRGDTSTMPPRELEAMIGVNVTALTTLCTLFGAEMKSKRHGGILNIASTAAYQPTPYMAAYGASKTYVVHFTEALGRELDAFGVHVCCISPGPTLTNFWERCSLGETKVGLFDVRNRVTPDKVAAVALRAMQQRRRHAVVGLGNSMQVFLNRFIPRATLSSISKRIMSPYQDAAVTDGIGRAA